MAENLAEVIGLVIALGVIAVTALLRDFLWSRSKALLELLMLTGHNLTWRDVRTDRCILDVLVELRVRVDADRAYVYQFHNGSYFTTKNPVWKMSCTHEVCRAGIAYVAREMQALPVSIMMEYLAGLWGDADTLPHGVENVMCQCANEKQTVLWYAIDEIPESMGKSLLRAHGVCCMLLAPLRDGENIVGLVGVDYCDVTTGEASEFAAALCEAASQIPYILTQDQKRRRK